jgi:hypothetical protein
MREEKTTFNMRLSKSEENTLKDNAKLIYGKDKCATKYILSLIDKDKSRVKRIKKHKVINDKIQRFIDWLPIATIEEGYNNFVDYFEIEDEDYGFQITAYYYRGEFNDIMFMINGNEYILTKEQHNKILAKIK